MSGSIDDEGSCDGVHDEGAPVHHLCTRCFPELVAGALRGDLSEPTDNEYQPDQEAEEEEME